MHTIDEYQVTLSWWETNKRRLWSLETYIRIHKDTPLCSLGETMIWNWNYPVIRSVFAPPPLCWQEIFALPSIFSLESHHSCHLKENELKTEPYHAASHPHSDSKNISKITLYNRMHTIDEYQVTLSWWETNKRRLWSLETYIRMHIKILLCIP